MNIAIMTESEIVSQYCRQITEVVNNPAELRILASTITGLGLRMQWLGNDIERPEMTDAGNHLYKLGCDLQGIAIIRMDLPRIS